MKTMNKFNWSVLMVSSFLGIHASAGGGDRPIVNPPKEIRFKLDFESVSGVDCTDVNEIYQQFVQKNCTLETAKNVECDLLFQNLKQRSIHMARHQGGYHGPFSAKIVSSGMIDMDAPAVYVKRFDRDLLKSVLMNELPEALSVHPEAGGVHADMIRKMDGELALTVKRNALGDFEFWFKNKLLFCQMKEGKVELQNRMQVAYITESTVGPDSDRIFTQVIQDIEKIKKKNTDELSKYFALGLAIAHSFEGTQIANENLDQKVMIAQSLESMLMDHSQSTFKTFSADLSNAYRSFTNNRKLSYEKVIFSSR